MSAAARLTSEFGVNGWRVTGAGPIMLGVCYAGRWRWFCGRDLAEAANRAISAAAKVEA